jgi:isocitrate dehydrogenase kinase/phosphatase
MTEGGAEALESGHGVPPGGEAAPLGAAAAAIRASFLRHQGRFRAVTRRAPDRQVGRDWLGMQRDVVERIELYEDAVAESVTAVRQALGAHLHCRECWTGMRGAYEDAVAGQAEAELARTFFNSTTRRVFGTRGVDAAIEFVGPDFERGQTDGPPAYTTYPHEGSTAALVRAILEAHPAGAAYRNVDGDAALVAREIDAHRAASWGDQDIEAADVLDGVFYRNKGVYLVGRLRGGRRLMPLVIALVNADGRLAADAALCTVDEASIVFSFTRAAFHVDVAAPARAIRFLKSIMPAKRVAELYVSLGYAKHGKAELYRDLMAHLEQSADVFDVAPGDRGLVMVVFTLPSYDVVFKVIRDAFEYPKQTTRRHVLDRYRLVFRHDRAGRLVDAQEFEHLAFPRHRFSERLVSELVDTAGQSVMLEGDRLVIRHLYAERRVTPLNLYLARAADASAREAVLDFGRCIKDLAATNIFPGDLLLKNFGVTRHGRVTFYDYDELTLLTECTFREMPEPRTPEEEMAAEPWFHVGPHDIFPVELGTFMGLYGPLRELFLSAHGDLLGTGFWRQMQALHRAGEVMDIFPYRPGRRLRRLHA